MHKYLILLLSFPAFADSSHEVINNYNEVINQYIEKDCKSAALASAIGNNQMGITVRKPQLSIGIGECGGEYAGSLMFGDRACDTCPMINGSIGMTSDVTTFGVGITIPLK